MRERPAGERTRALTTARGPLVLPQPPIRPKAPTAVEIASDYLRALIFRGILRSGDRIPIDQIADVLGISRQPIREALITMVHDDLVVAEPKRGTFVNTIGPDTILEHFDLFGVLAARSVSRLVVTADDALIAQIKELARRADELTAPGAPLVDIGEVSRALLEFQRLVHHARATPRLSMLLRSMQRFVPGEVYLSTVPAGVDAARRFRRALLEALDNRDPDAAARAVMAQMREGGVRFCEELHRQGVFAS